MVFIVVVLFLVGVQQSFCAASDAVAAETVVKVISVVVGQDAAAVEREEVLRRLLFNAVERSDISEVKRLLALGYLLMLVISRVGRH